MTATTAPPRWQELDPSMARTLVDARLQSHHAAQLAAAIGISYVPKKADDSHTNLEWLHSVNALASRLVATATPFRVAMRPWPLSLLVLDERNTVVATYALHDKTIQKAFAWLRDIVAGVHADPVKLTLNRHYAIPWHPVDDGGPFDATDDRAFNELSRWYGDAALVLVELALSTPGASEVRCWPHNFDIATLIEVEPTRGSDHARTVGVGIEPGDNYYAEPYAYVSMYPRPPVSRATAPLDGGGTWHTHEWIGAVLPGSRLVRANQREQIESFFRSGMRAGTELVKPN